MSDISLYPYVEDFGVFMIALLPLTVILTLIVARYIYVWDPMLLLLIAVDGLYLLIYGQGALFASPSRQIHDAWFFIGLAAIMTRWGFTIFVYRHSERRDLECM